MAPEQLEGKDADARTDLFAFGALLYEMVTGKRAFEGKSQASLIAAIMEHEPTPITQLEPMSPSALENVVKTCLAKDPDERWQTAGDVGRQLKWIAEGDTATGDGAETRTIAAMKRERWLFLTVAIILAGLASWSLLKPLPRSVNPVTRIEVSLPFGQELTNFIAISPAGDRVAYVAGQGTAAGQLYIRDLDEFEARPIAGTEGAIYPFFSPDGEWVGFSAEGKLQRVAVKGGTPVAITDAPQFGGGSWREDDTIVFSNLGVGLLRVPAEGGPPETLITSDDATIGYAQTHPQILPDGKHVLFTTAKSDPRFENRVRIGVLSLETGEWKIVLQGGEGARFVESGHLLYSPGESTLHAVAFDPTRLEVSGKSVPILEELYYSFPAGRAFFAVSQNGTLAYVPGSMARRTLVWVDREGRERPVMEEQGEYSFPTLSPDGSRVALVQRPDIWVLDLDRGTKTRLQPGGHNFSPVWTPDGSRVVFTSNRDAGVEMHSAPANGMGDAEKILARDFEQLPMSWTPDGKLMAFADMGPATGLDIWMLSHDGEPSPFLVTPFREGSARFSPDGRFLAYVSDESGRDEVYVLPYPGPGSRWTISTEGGTEPVWSRDGKELFYRHGDELIEVDIETDPGFSVGASHRLFRGTYLLGTALTYTNTTPQYDVSPDGREFLMVRRDPGSVPTRINIALNWFEELERLVPTGN